MKCVSHFKWKAKLNTNKENNSFQRIKNFVRWHFFLQFIDIKSTPSSSNFLHNFKLHLSCTYTCQNIHVISSKPIEKITIWSFIVETNIYYQIFASFSVWKQKRYLAGMPEKHHYIQAPLRLKWRQKYRVHMNPDWYYFLTFHDFFLENEYEIRNTYYFSWPAGVTNDVTNLISKINDWAHFVDSGKKAWLSGQRFSRARKWIWKMWQSSIYQTTSRTTSGARIQEQLSVFTILIWSCTIMPSTYSLKMSSTYIIHGKLKWNSVIS